MRPVAHLRRACRRPEALDVPFGAEGEPLERRPAQPVDLRLLRQMLAPDRLGHHPLGEIVDFGEALAVGGGELAGIPQVIERELVGRAPPHLALARDPGVERLGAERPFRRDPGQKPRPARFVEHAAMPFPAAHLLLHLPEAAPPAGVEVHRDHRGIVGEMLEDPALAKQPVEHRLAIMLVAAPDDVVVRPGDDLDRVELDEAQAPDDREDVERPRRRQSEALGVEPETASVAIGDAEHHRFNVAHRSSRRKSGSRNGDTYFFVKKYVSPFRASRAASGSPRGWSRSAAPG